MRCSRFCQHRPISTAIILTAPPWKREMPPMLSGKPYSPPHYCSRLEEPSFQTGDLLSHEIRDTQSLPKNSTYRERIERSVVRKDPSLYHLLTIQTAIRPNQSSLPTTLDSLEQAGVKRWNGPKIIVSDGYAPDVPPSWKLFVVSTKQPALGSAKTFVKLLRLAIATDPLLEYLTYFQDDIVLAKNSLDYISQVAIPKELSLVSWFNTDWHKPDFTPPAVLGHRATSLFIRSQAVTFTRMAVNAMLYCHEVTHWPKLDACDAMPAWALADIPYADHYPGLVQHTEGFNSACNLTFQQHQLRSKCPHNGERTSPSFVGENFDALSLWEP